MPKPSRVLFPSSQNNLQVKNSPQLRLSRLCNRHHEKHSASGIKISNFLPQITYPIRKHK